MSTVLEAYGQTSGSAAHVNLCLAHDLTQCTPAKDTPAAAPEGQREDSFLMKKGQRVDKRQDKDPSSVLRVDLLACLCYH